MTEKKETRKIVRSYDAGVFFGEIIEQDDANRKVVLKNARNFWSWSGANSLATLATTGTADPSNCRFSVEVEEITVYNVCEILSVTAKAGENIDGVPRW